MVDTRRVSLKHAAKDMETKRAKCAVRKEKSFEMIKKIYHSVERPNLRQSMKRINLTDNVNVLSKYKPNPKRFCSRPTPKASKFVDIGTADHVQVIKLVLKKSQFNRQPHTGSFNDMVKLKKTQDGKRRCEDLVADYTQRQEAITSGMIYKHLNLD